MKKICILAALFVSLFAADNSWMNKWSGTNESGYDTQDSVSLSLSDYEKIVQIFVQTNAELNVPKCQSRHDRDWCYELTSGGGDIRQYVSYVDYEVNMFHKFLYEGGKKTGAIMCSTVTKNDVANCEVYKITNAKLVRQNSLYGTKAQQLINEHLQDSNQAKGANLNNDEKKAMERFKAVLELTERYPQILEGDMMNENDAQKSDEQLKRLMIKDYGNAFASECIGMLESME